MSSYTEDEAAGLDPVELYEFILGESVWRYTDTDATMFHPTTLEGYEPTMISRGNLNQTEEDSSMSVKVTLDVFDPVADFFRTPFLPLHQLWLTIYRTHIGGSGAVATIFRGRAGQCDFEGTTASITCIPTRAAIQKEIPVQLVQSLCNNTLYDGRCKADPASFSESATITSISGLTLTVSWASRDTTARPAGWFDGGYIEKAETPLATILNDVLGSPTTLKILYNPGYGIGDVITAFAGCDKRSITCREKFNNLPHHQGFPNFPQQDPFTNEVL